MKEYAHPAIELNIPRIVYYPYILHYITRLVCCLGAYRKENRVISQRTCRSPVLSYNELLKIRTGGAGFEESTGCCR
jgi:hypothetical protein